MLVCQREDVSLRINFNLIGLLPIKKRNGMLNVCFEDIYIALYIK